ncbi:hypothetical protein [Bradyrhizobium sp.]|uniref:hypothetical protein n=1 Tax=Bradyrhizobium sp. TaxID=376 RepID=UPI003919C0B2
MSAESPAPAPRSNSYTLAAASSDAGPAETVAPTASSQTVAEAAPTASTGAGEQPVKRVSQVSMVPRDDVRYDDQYEVEDLLARYSGQARRKS